MNFSIVLLILSVTNIGIISSQNAAVDGGLSINPCAAVRCPANTECTVEQIQCFTTPCNPTVSCKPIGGTTNPCAATLCPVNTQCVVQQVQCFAAPCNPVANCIPIETPQPQPPSCATQHCGYGQTCILQQVQCIRAPCYPQPQCVPAISGRGWRNGPFNQ